jgi:flagellar motility protein MotE (MotC chaperone)
MMDHASFGPIVLAAGGIFFLGLILPAATLAGDQGWAPVVATTNAASPLFDAQRPPTLPTPPLPHAKPAEAKKQAPAKGALAAVPPSVPAPSDTSDITTGSIDAIESKRMLSPTDSARLFAEDGDAPLDALITGTVDAQGSDLARGYCANIAGTAAEARIALQRAKLAEAEKAIGYRLTALEVKTAEYKGWVDRRDQFLKRATDALVKIYTQMEPDAASLQLAAMDEETAAALLVKLEPQNASSILNEMAPEKAARLTATIAGAVRMPKPNPNAAPAGAAAAPPTGYAPQRADPREGRS